MRKLCSMGVCTPALARYSQLTAVPQISRDKTWPMTTVFTRRLVSKIKPTCNKNTTLDRPAAYRS